MSRLLCLTLFCLLPVLLEAEEDRGLPDLDDVLAMDVVRDAELSPTGAHVAWRVFRNDFDDDRQDEQLWMAPVAGGEALQLTRGEASVEDYEWSPDGRWLLFLRDGELFALRVAGGEAVGIELEGVGRPRDLRFAPDGSALFFLASPEPDAWAEAREEAHGEYTVFREDGDYAHLWRLALTEDMAPDEEPEALTEGSEFTVRSYAISPDGARIVFVAWPTPHLVDLLDARVMIVSADGGPAEPLADEPGVEGSLVWRRDGARIAFTASPGFPDYADIVSLTPDGRERRVFEMPEHDARLVAYDAEGLLFEAGLRTAVGRFRLDPASGEVTDLDGGGFHAGTTLSADGRVMAWTGTETGGLAEVLVRDGAGTRALTRFDEQFAGFRRPRQTLVQWTSFDGLEIEGVLTWPLDHDAGRTYPLFVRTHGGPTGTDRPGVMFDPRSIYSPTVLAGRGEGAFVLQTNYRGSAGYGDAFQKTNLRQLGIGPARDILAGIEKLVSDGLVDPERVGCLGWSQGGHISAMLATYSDACTAAIMGAGISDWRTYYYNTDITQFTTEYFGATPLADDDVYALTSPVTYIDRASTPTLVQHGERDARVPIANGYQLRQLLLDRGVPSRMIVYAGMGHGPRTPRHRRAITAHALAWFDQWLFDGPRADFVRPVEPDEGEGDEEDGD